jgi:hydrogenase maturation protease
MNTQGKVKLAVVGIGNILVGDDGAGIAVLNILKEKWERDPRVRFYALEGDLYEISDYLDTAESFLFVDAVAGSTAGDIVESCFTPRAYAPSFHQTDIGSVMQCMQALGITDPFPPWTLWGITVDPPRQLSPTLSPVVAQAVGRLAEHLTNLLPRMLATHSPVAVA